MTVQPAALRPAGPPLPAEVVLDGRTLTPATVAAVAEGAGIVRLAPAARARNAASREALETVIAKGTPVYGTTTGVGALHDRPVTRARAPSHQRDLLRSHAAGAGEPLPPAAVRAAMLVRLNQLGAGGGAASDGLLDSSRRPSPRASSPSCARSGRSARATCPACRTSGSCCSARARPGRRAGAPARGQRCAGPASRPSPPARATRWRSFSSNAVTIGRAALTAVRAQRLCDAAIVVAALSFEAIDADQSPLDARVHAARPLPGQTAVAARMRALLAGSDPRRHGPGLHDPLAFRCQPQVDGAAQDALAALHRVLAVELNAAAENPLVVAGPEPVALTPATSTPSRSPLSARRPPRRAGPDRVARGRPRQRAARRALQRPARLAGRDPRASSGAMALEYTAHAAAAEVRMQATPAAAQHTVVGAGMESHASFAALSVRHTDAALDAYSDALATELVLAARALRVAGRAPAGVCTGRSSSAWSPICPRD